MDQEQLIRQIMNQVLASVGQAPAPAPAGAAPKYPLGENVPEQIKSASGKPLAEYTLDKVLNGQLTAEDFRIAPETLELQAQVAEGAGRGFFARNLRRAAELIAVPDAELLQIYNALRPYRSTKEELYAIADKLQNQYKAQVSAGFVREAADEYERRGRLKAA